MRIGLTFRSAFLLLFALAATQAKAALEIDIIGGRESATPIAVACFIWAPPGAAAAGGADGECPDAAAADPPERFETILANDLERSGRFAPLDNLPQHPAKPEDIRWADWGRLRVGNLVIGTIARAAGAGAGADAYDVEFRLYDTFTRARLAGQRYEGVPRAQLRWIAHRMSDEIYLTLTGEQGAFATRIAYVTEDRRVTEAGGAGNAADVESTFKLIVADSDGANPVEVRTSPDPIMSPSWSPDGRRIAYVSYRGRSSRIVVQEVATGRYQAVADFAGINGAPAFSPDGEQLALTLSRDGNPEIYVLTLATGALRRITQHRGIDTEPAWSPDGRNLVFTSDRSGGRAQLFLVPATGGSATRLVFAGQYNARAAFSPDGKRIVFVHGAAGRGYRIATMEIGAREITVLTNGSLDESPVFAPNGRMILYATSEWGRASLAAVSIDGNFRQRLSIEGTGVRDPAWSPIWAPR